MIRMSKFSHVAILLLASCSVAFMLRHSSSEWVPIGEQHLAQTRVGQLPAPLPDHCCNKSYNNSCYNNGPIACTMNPNCVAGATIWSTCEDAYCEMRPNTNQICGFRQIATTVGGCRIINNSTTTAGCPVGQSRCNNVQPIFRNSPAAQPVNVLGCSFTSNLCLPAIQYTSTCE